MKKLIVVGSGMSAMRVVDELLALKPSKYQITVVGDEDSLPYNRIMLSPLLANEKIFQDIVTHSEEYFTDNKITFKRGLEVIDIHRPGKYVILSNKEVLHYDKLVLCTGSKAFVLPVPGNNIKGVISFRDINDVAIMKSISGSNKKAVIIGSGLLGLEAANGLNEIGFSVTVISNVDHLMDRQLDVDSSKLLQNTLEDKGIKFKFNASTKEIHSKYNKVSYVEFEDGYEMIADLVVMAVGILPNYTLAEGSGVICKKGVLVNNTMQTFDPNIYAVGECVNHKGANFGLITPLFDQARVCAEQLAEKPVHQFVSFEYSTRLKISGTDVFSDKIGLDILFRY